jgi:hypothetical protein
MHGKITIKLIQLQGIVILSVSLHGCETLGLLLKGKGSLRMFEKVALRRYLDIKESGGGATVRYMHKRAE